MKRPLFLIGSTMLLSQLILMKAEDIAVAVFSVCAVAALILVQVLQKLLFKRNHSGDIDKKYGIFLCAKTVLIAVIVSCVMFCVMQNVSQSKALECIGDRDISVKLTEYPEKRGDRYYVVGKYDGHKIRVSLSPKKAEPFIRLIKPGDTLEFYAKVYKLGSGIKNIEDNFKSKRLYLGAYPYRNVTLIQAESINPYYCILKERENIKNRFLNFFDSKTAGIGIGVVLGDKNHIDSETYSEFRQTGAAHILAISGMHLSIWILFFSKFFTLLGVSRRKSSFALIIVVLFVMALTGFTGSICRAGIMMIVYLFGYILRRNPDGMNSLGFSAIVMLLLNPFSAGNISFLMSFCATLGIFVLFEPLENAFNGFIDIKISGRMIKFVVKNVFSAFMIGVSATLFISPLQVLSFGTFSLISPVTSLVLFPFIMPMVLCFGLFAFLYYIPYLSSMVAFFAEKISDCVCRIIGKLSSISIGTVSVHDEQYFVFFSCIALVVALVILSVYTKEKHLKPLSIITAIVLLFAFGFYSNTYYDFNAVISVKPMSDGMMVTSYSKGKKAVCFAQMSDYSASFVLEDVEDASLLLASDNTNQLIKNALSSADIVDSDGISSSNAGAFNISVNNGKITLSAYGKSIALFGAEENASADVEINKNIDNQELIVKKGDRIFSAENNDEIRIVVSQFGKIHLYGESVCQ